MPQPPPTPQELAPAFQGWLDERLDGHAALKAEPAHFDDKVRNLQALQRELFDAGWARYGWAQEHGGLGGSVLHRAVVADLLQLNGYPPRHLFEHLDILPPALQKFAKPELLKELFLPTLRGDLIWCQGFSEPTAGSDLAALRTRAERVEGGYRIEGHKIWTSWAKWSTHCFFLARTGTPEDRHRGLSAFVIRLDTPGVTVGAIRQANGHDELAEVFFDGALLPEGQRVGEEGQGWAVAMHILAGERGSYTWLRQCEILPRLEWLARRTKDPAHADLLGENLVRMIALRCRARAVMEILAQGEEPGPESSVTKVLAIDGEQFFYDSAREILSPSLDLGSCEDVDFWHEHYLYSRASSVYGGSRQIQLNVIAKLLITRGSAAQTRDDESQAVAQSVGEAIEQSEDGRAALEGLDWWSFAAAPEDAFARAAFSAWFEGQGRTLSVSPALAGVRLAHAAQELGVPASQLALGIEAGGGWLCCGFDAHTRFVVMESGEGLRAHPAEDLSPRPSRAFDARLLQQVELDLQKAREVPCDPEADARALALARLAAGFEILGASRRLLEEAVRHTNEREQFGQAIANFQAIQHLLSEAQIDISSLEELCAAGLEEWGAGGTGEFAMLAKSHAGRAGRDVAQRALQCFGAIGFTEEHMQHLYSRRIHSLDAVLGSYYQLRRRLGEALLQGGQAPRCIQAWRPSPPA